MESTAQTPSASLNSLMLFCSLLIFLSLLSLNTATIRILVGTCHASGFLTGQSGFCTTQNYADCCQAGKLYPQYRCSPPITNETSATLDVGGFSQGSDGGAAAECDGNFHEDNELVVALPTGWFDNKSRCQKKIRINVNGKSVLAKVIDECDSVNGFTADLNYESPCPPDVSNASPGVWNTLGIPTSKEEVPITWSEA